MHYLLPMETNTAQNTETNTTKTVEAGDLHCYKTGHFLRKATITETIEGLRVTSDTGAFVVDGQSVYIEG